MEDIYKLEVLFFNGRSVYEIEKNEVLSIERYIDSEEEYYIVRKKTENVIIRNAQYLEYRKNIQKS